jgi:uncharacterized protein (TIGR03083 family)
MLQELQERAEDLQRNWLTFSAFLNQLTDDQWQIPVGGEGYSARQTVAHLAGADKSMTRMAANWIAGRDNTLRPDFDLDFFNSRQQARRADMTNAELVTEWREAQEGVLAFLEKVQPEDLDKRGEHPTGGNVALRGLFKIITMHEAQHIALVMNALST